MCKRIKIVRRWRDNLWFCQDFRRSMTLQSHSTKAVNRIPVNCIVGTHSIRCQKARFKDEILGGAGRTIPECMSFILCGLRMPETRVVNSRCLIPKESTFKPFLRIPGDADRRSGMMAIAIPG